MAPRFTAVCLLLLAAASSRSLLHAQQPPPAPQQQFRAGTELVTVDFVAVDGTGRPITDLKPGEVTLKVDGKSRQIRALEFLKVAPTSAEAPVTRPLLAPPFGTNQSSAPGRIVILVVDHEHIGPGEGKPAIDAAGRFLDRLTPLDRVGLVTMPSGNVEVDLTTNHARVRQALAGLTGKAVRLNPFRNISVWEAMQVQEEQNQSDTPITTLIQDRECTFSTAADGTCRINVVREALQMAREIENSTRASLNGLRDFFDGVAKVEGPKSVVFLSGSLIPTPGVHFDMAEVARSATAAHAQLYVIQPHEIAFDVNGRNEPMAIEKDMTLRLQGLEDLTASAGGVLFRLSSAGDSAFTRIADEISAYYLLGFEATTQERDGKRHTIELATSRSQVTLRSRPAFIIGAPTHENTAPLLPESMLRDFVLRRDLPLRATAYPFRNADKGDMKVVVAVEPIETTTTLTSAAFALIDIKGRVAAQWTEDGANVVSRPLLTATVVPPGEYRLRVAAVDSASRRGAVDYEFLATLGNAAPLRLGTLMLGTTERGSFRPRLIAGPNDASVTAYMEIYGNPPVGSKLTVTLEIAASPDGPATVSAPADLLMSAEPDRRVTTGSLPIGSLPSGDVVVRAVVKLDDKVLGSAWRTLRK